MTSCETSESMVGLQQVTEWEISPLGVSSSTCSNIPSGRIDFQMQNWQRLERLNSCDDCSHWTLIWLGTHSARQSFMNSTSTSPTLRQAFGTGRNHGRWLEWTSTRTALLSLHSIKTTSLIRLLLPTRKSRKNAIGTSRCGNRCRTTGKSSLGCLSNKRDGSSTTISTKSHDTLWSGCRSLRCCALYVKTSHAQQYRLRHADEPPPT